LEEPDPTFSDSASPKMLQRVFFSEALEVEPRVKHPV